MPHPKYEMPGTNCQVLTAVFAFPRQACQRCQLLQVFAEWTCRSSPEDDVSPANYLIRQDAAARSENYARLDRRMVSDANLASNDRTVSDLDTSRNAGLRCDHDVGSDRHVMANMDQVVELRSRSEERRVGKEGRSRWA